MTDGILDPVVEDVVVEETTLEVVEEGGTPEFDMGMSDEEFEKTDFEALEKPSEGIGAEGDPDVPVAELDGSGDPITAVELDKAAEYDKIMAEFKANGKMTSVSNSDEVRQLMKMGAGFNKKMTGLKSTQKYVKMLENNGLLDEEKLNYLIDLDKRNPDAIAKLLKDSEISPHDLDIESDTEYRPNAYNVDDRQVHLDNVIEDLQDSSGYATTIDIVGNKWDKTSRETLAGTPEDIKVINSHVESGIYDQIVEVVEKEKMLGKLQGMDDYTAYRTIGDAMNAAGMFNIAPQANTNTQIDPPAKKSQPNVNDKKRAASAPKGKPKAKETHNIQDMTDDEFEAKYGASLQ
jgi:hypothetical protein